MDKLRQHSAQWHCIGAAMDTCVGMGALHSSARENTSGAGGRPPANSDTCPRYSSSPLSCTIALANVSGGIDGSVSVGMLLSRVLYIGYIHVLYRRKEREREREWDRVGN